MSRADQTTSDAEKTMSATDIKASTVSTGDGAGKASRNADPQTVLGLNHGDRRILAVLICVALALMVIHWYRLTQYRPQPLQILHPPSYEFRLDVNSATWVEWMQLDGIGETLARRIVADRQQSGPFASLDDVRRVNGIGPGKMESLRPHLMLRPTPTDANE